MFSLDYAASSSVARGSQLSSYGTNSDNSPITLSTVKLSRSLAGVQEEESDGDDILNVL